MIKSHKWKRRFFTGVIHFFLILGGLTMVFPFYWMMSTSFKDTKEVMAFPPTWIPSKAKFFYYNIKTGKPLMVEGFKEKVRDLLDVHGRNKAVLSLEVFRQTVSVQRDAALGRFPEAERPRVEKVIISIEKIVENEVMNFRNEPRVNEDFIRRSLNKFVTNMRKAVRGLHEKFPALSSLSSIVSANTDSVERVKENILAYEKSLLMLDFTGNEIDFKASKVQLTKLVGDLRGTSGDVACLDEQEVVAASSLDAIERAPSHTGKFFLSLAFIFISIIGSLGLHFLLQARLPDEEEEFNLKKTAKYLLPKLLFVAILMPVYYAIGQEEFSRLFVNYSKAWYKNSFDRYFFNSFYIAVVTTFFQILTSGLAAYAFAFMEFKGRNLLFLAFLATMMIPAQAILVPNYLILAQLHWIDTYWALIFPFCAAVFGIFLLRQFFMAVPRELYDASIIDGCSRFGFFWRILIPLSVPAVTTMGIFTFIGSWNSFLWALIVTHRDSLRTIQVGLSTFKDAEGTKFELLMAASTFCILPLVIGFFLAQKQFIEGISRSGMKG